MDSIQFSYILTEREMFLRSAACFGLGIFAALIVLFALNLSCANAPSLPPLPKTQITLSAGSAEQLTRTLRDLEIALAGQRASEKK